MKSKVREIIWQAKKGWLDFLVAFELGKHPSEFILIQRRMLRVRRNDKPAMVIRNSDKYMDELSECTLTEHSAKQTELEGSGFYFF